MQPIHPIHFDVHVSSVAGHLIDIEMTVFSPNSDGQIVSLPSWIPGSYMIRDFAKSIVSMEAKDADGNTLIIEKLDKQTWHIEACTKVIKVIYQIYCFDHSVRSAFICDQYAFFNGTSAFLQVKGQEQVPISVLIKPGEQTASTQQWQVATAMSPEQIDHDGYGVYVSDNYADLIEHPIVIGQLDSEQFTVRDIPFRSVLVGGHYADHKKIVDDLKVICEHHFALFDAPLPIDRYVFLTMISDNGFGGLEHTYSTALMYDRASLITPKPGEAVSEGYRGFLALCSHEFFHTWHVKRNRPIELIQGSLQAETYTEQLWIYEGFTSYYDDLSLVRCGLISFEDYLTVLGENLTRLARNPGIHKQSVSESSFYAWTKFYKQNEGSVNHIVSYYTKGAFIALCLDLKIRLETDGQTSLDDVMRKLWLQHGSQHIGTQKDVIETILKSNFRLDLTDFIHLATQTTAPLPVGDLLNQFGVELVERAANSLNDKGGKPVNNMLTKGFGAALKKATTGAIITKVLEDSPAYRAGLQVNDQIIALNQWQISADTIMQHIERCDMGDVVEFTLLRDKQLLRLPFTVEAAPVDTVYLKIVDEEKLQKWLSPTT